MTPALKAMVEAMLAEIRRQNALDPTVSDPPPTGTVVFVSGAVDLAKVAQAGLAAIKGSGGAFWDAASEANDGDQGNYADVLDAMIDAILAVP